MKLILAAAQLPDCLQVAAVAFDAWESAEADRTYTTRAPLPQEPAPRGAPDLRALPTLLQLLHQHALAPEVIVIDGFVDLDPAGTQPGFGRALFDALQGRAAVVGLSKSAMKPATPEQFEVHREDETPPLVVTTAGLDLGAAKARVRAMHGRKRVPTLVKLAARLAKGSGD